MKDLRFPFRGSLYRKYDGCNSIAMMCGVQEDDIRKGVLLFQGVRRRFDIRVNMPGLHTTMTSPPSEEIKACITSVREYFRGRKITGIFASSYSRTRDHAQGFARILDELDGLFTSVYPAREEPIPGVSSEIYLI